MWIKTFGLALSLLLCLGLPAQELVLDSTTLDNLDQQILQLQDINQQLQTYNEQILTLTLKISELQQSGNDYAMELEKLQISLKYYQDKVQALQKNSQGLLNLSEKYRDAYTNYKTATEILGITTGVVIIIAIVEGLFIGSLLKK